MKEHSEKIKKEIVRRRRRNARHNSKIPIGGIIMIDQRDVITSIVLISPFWLTDELFIWTHIF